MKKNIILLLLSFITISTFTFSGAAYAEDAGSGCAILPGVSCNGEGASGDGIQKVLVIALQIMTAGVGVAAVGAFIYAGILYGTASGDSSKVSNAKTIIINTTIGILAYALMGLVLNFLVPGGILQ